MVATSNSVILPRNAQQVLIPGPSGVLDSLILQPKESICGVAIIIHPDPKGGGTYTNKIVQSIAKVLNAKGYLCYCPNLRGVGNSTGEHDYGNGEIDDASAIHDYLRQTYPTLPLTIAGFSFGSAVAAGLASRVPHQQLILVGPAVTRYRVELAEPSKALVIHGQDDEVIPLAAVYEWADPYGIPVSVFTKTGHFFHGKLVPLQIFLTHIVVG